jgi:hypothetical protein
MHYGEKQWCKEQSFSAPLTVHPSLQRAPHSLVVLAEHGLALFVRHLRMSMHAGWGGRWRLCTPVMKGPPSVEQAWTHPIAWKFLESSSAPRNKKTCFDSLTANLIRYGFQACCFGESLAVPCRCAPGCSQA